MAKVNFKNLEALTSFEGDMQTFDTSKVVGNLMMYNGSVLLDIGFEDLAKTIYYSEDVVEVPERYVEPIIEVIKQSSVVAAVKRGLIKQLSAE